MSSTGRVGWSGTSGARSFSTRRPSRVRTRAMLAFSSQSGTCSTSPRKDAPTGTSSWSTHEGGRMATTDHKIGTRDEWQVARDDLAKLEAEHAELGRKAAEKRRELPWVPVDKEYEFDTEDGKKSLLELFEGRS